MSDFIPKVPPIWQTQLAFELDPADSTATIATELLIGGGSLSGLVCVSVDIGQPNPEYIIGTLSGNTITITLRNVDPLDPTTSLGAFTSIHRQGAVVKITDFATIQIMRNILNGDQVLQNLIRYATALTPVNPGDIVDKAYVDAISVAGAPDASTTAKGLSRLSYSPNVTLGNPTITIASPAVVTLTSHGLTINDSVQFTTSGSLPTGISPSTNYFVISAGLTANAFEIAATIGGTAINTSGSQSGTHTLIKTTPVVIGVNDPRVDGNNYGVPAGGTDTYAITLTNAPAAYVAGQTYAFKADVANTGVCTLNVNGLGAKSLKVNGNLDPQDNYIKAGQIIVVKYDGTNMQIISVAGKPSVSQSGEEIYGVPNGGTDTYAITVAPVPAAYVAGMVFRFKADVANTGAASLNVNGLGAITIVKSFNVTLSDGDIKAGQLVEVEYDGTNFQMLSPVTAPSTLTPTNYIPPQIIGLTANPIVMSCDKTGLSTSHGLVFGPVGAMIGAALLNYGNIVRNATGGSTSANPSSNAVVGGFVYYNKFNGSVWSIARVDENTLANDTGMTASGFSAPGQAVSMFSDGTFLYIYDSGNTVRKLSISGTTLTSVSTITFTGIILLAPTWSDGTSVYQYSTVSSILKWPIAGGSSTNFTTYNFGSPGGSNITAGAPAGIVGVLGNTSMAILTTITSATAGGEVAASVWLTVIPYF